MAHGLAILKAAGPRKHRELVALLKAEHGLGRGHANALVAHHLAAREGVQEGRQLNGADHTGSGLACADPQRTRGLAPCLGPAC